MASSSATVGAAPLPSANAPFPSSLSTSGTFHHPPLEPVKSSGDERTYRILTLPNGLHALLIHDAETDKASAALDVGVGHWCDPPHLPGLAHFLEHMLFLGTDKYPDENEYSAFLNAHGQHSRTHCTGHSTAGTLGRRGERLRMSILCTRLQSSRW